MRCFASGRPPRPAPTAVRTSPDLVEPLREALGQVEGQLHEPTRPDGGLRLAHRAGRFARSTREALRAQTSSLVTRCGRRRPAAAGVRCSSGGSSSWPAWWSTATSPSRPRATATDGTLRPDLVVRLAGGKQVVVDAKVSLSAYLEAAETDDDDVAAERLRAHARHLRAHVAGLAAKEYWRAFQPTPEFVVLFVPGDAFLAPALERDPQLLEDAMRAQVLIATPTTLIAMLRTVAYAWQQEALTEHARSVFELGQELYRRLGKLGGHVDKLGRSLSRAVERLQRDGRLAGAHRS